MNYIALNSSFCLHPSSFSPSSRATLRHCAPFPPRPRRRLPAAVQPEVLLRRLADRPFQRGGEAFGDGADFIAPVVGHFQRVDNLLAADFVADPAVVVEVVRQSPRVTDADKRPVFPYAGAAGLMGVNAAGSANVTQLNTFNPFGLNLVADRNFASSTLVVARGAAIEFYEQIRGLMSVEAPATLGRTFSYYGYVATFIADADQVQSVLIA